MSSPPTVEPYRPKHHVRIVTAASLFDGHDAAINIMRRILQSSGAEVIHLGHNRSVQEIVRCAIQEDAQGIALTSYQGGHVEYLEYMVDLLREAGAKTKVFGGGGGTILPDEIERLHAHGVARLFSPDDGRAMGLQGMINLVLEQCDFETVPASDKDTLLARLGEAHEGSPTDPQVLGRLISIAENAPEAGDALRDAARARMTDGRTAERTVPVLGITGTGGAGKSSLVDELVRRFLRHAKREDGGAPSIAVLSVDPSKRKSGGALLGDRIRMNAIDDPRVYMRSLATRQSNLAVSKHVQHAVDLCKAAGYDLVVVETSGIGQSDTAITDLSDASLYVMTSEYGAATQLEKIDMLDFADVIAINKFDKRGSLDALRDVRKQYKRNHQRFTDDDESLPVFGTIASQFNDPGTNRLFAKLMDVVADKGGVRFTVDLDTENGSSEKVQIVPPDRVRYLAEIVEGAHRYQDRVDAQCQLAHRLDQLRGAIAALREAAEILDPEAGVPLSDPGEKAGDPPEVVTLRKRYDALLERLDADAKRLLREWPEVRARYADDVFRYQVRGKTIEQPLTTESLSHTRIPRVSLPRFESWREILRWRMTENLPGAFPFAAGVFPLKRSGEAPARMFAGEGGPERTNKRFHYVSHGMPAKRLSTAFDSVTLYGEDPDHRPDIYGKIGNSGVSIATLDDAKKLYSGFDLCDPRTSVSMTINGPAPMLLGFFFNAAIDQQCEKHILAEGLEAEVDAKIDAIYAGKGVPRPRYHGELPEGNDGLGLRLLGVTGDQVLPRETYEKIKAHALASARGTVQADILKEDQAQNTCIFSTEFALRMMGDIQQYFIDHDVTRFYSVSISGYHIAEAGANPISQLAFTLANGFTFVEYYLARGMDVNAFAPNFSFFFSNGVDPEYSVIGRVARRIWAKAIKHRYGGGERAQKLKYHIQTSGRSLHAQEIAFNDIRTTLQALYAIYDNCNSLHTNAYDEAITTPTEESVRRALAIQLIIDQELGLAKNENPLQGSFIIDELTDLVEEAVYAEFVRISDRGGVLGAMERMYQRSKIQEESLYYESLKHTGELPLIGVNTFLSSEGSPTVIPREVIRSTEEERVRQIDHLVAFHERNADASPAALATLQEVATQHGNLFEALMECTKVCSLGQISGALYEVGGQYRRNM